MVKFETFDDYIGQSILLKKEDFKDAEKWQSVKKSLVDYGYTLFEEDVVEELCWGKEENGKIEYLDRSTTPATMFTEETGDFLVTAIPYHRTIFKLIDMIIFKDAIMQQKSTNVSCENDALKEHAFNKISDKLKGKRFIAKDYDKYYINFNKTIFNSLCELDYPEIYIMDSDIEEKYFIKMLEVVEEKLNENNKKVD